MTMGEATQPPGENSQTRPRQLRRTPSGPGFMSIALGTVVAQIVIESRLRSAGYSAVARPAKVRDI